MFYSDKDVNDCQKFYMYFVYRDFLFSSGSFSLTLGFSELAEDQRMSCNLVCSTGKHAGGFLGARFRKLEF